MLEKLTMMGMLGHAALIAFTSPILGDVPPPRHRLPHISRRSAPPHIALK